MPRTSTASWSSQKEHKAGTFFLATLLLWLVSVLFEILFNGRKELIFIVAGCCFFQLANWVIRVRVSRDPLFVNTCVSLLHSTLTSASAYIPTADRLVVHFVELCLKLLPTYMSHKYISSAVVFILVNQWFKDGSTNMFGHSCLFGNTWSWAYQALCFSCGYFAYDQWDMLQYHLYSGWIPSILVHHLILLICFTLALYRNVTINYLILTLICELHSIFLHVRKVRRMAGIRDAKSLTVRIEWILNWFTYLFARFIPHVMITAKLILDAHKFKKGVELPLALFGMAGMNLLNIGLGIDLLNAYRRERTSPVKSRLAE